MRRLAALSALVALVAALALPAGAATKTKSNFALQGEARALEVAIGDQGVTLGFALSRANSLPEAIGVGAGQCTLLGDSTDPNSLPCSQENTEQSRFPGNPGDGQASCSQALPAPLSDVLALEIACGSSVSGLKKGLPFTTNEGKVAELRARLPLGALLPVNPTSEEQVEQLVDTLTGTLQPILDQTPQEVQDAVDTLVNDLLSLVGSLDETDLIKVQVGPSFSNVTPKGDTLTVESTSYGARIGVIGMPTVGTDGSVLGVGDPLTDGLIIIEVGSATAKASVNKTTAASDSAASAAIVTVKVRDITKPEPTYIELSVAPGETVTILEGTPAESTIIAADSSTEKGDGTAAAAADAVRLHLLKGVNGGVAVGLARATAAANVDVAKAPLPQPKKPTLPVTGGTTMTGLAIALLVAAGGLVALRRRLGTN